MLDVQIQGSRAKPGALAASFFDASEDCVKIVSLDGDLLAMNANGICLMEIDDFEALRGQPWTSLWPEDERGRVQAAISQANGGRNSKFVADCPTGSGTLKSWEVVVWPVLDEHGRPREIISISRDITERRRADEERSLFTRELAHRIKNMFAVVDGVISLSARGAAEARPTIDALRARLHGLGRAIAYVSPPELLGREEQSDHTVLGLLRVLLEPYGAVEGADQRVVISGADAPIGKGATTSIALVIHELATNAMKYGSLSNSAGHVDVEVIVHPTSVRMIWREHGSPRLPGAPSVELKGFGSVLVENAVTRQLAGRYTRDWRAEGLVVDMTFPADRLSR